MSLDIELFVYNCSQQSIEKYIEESRLGGLLRNEIPIGDVFSVAGFNFEFIDSVLLDSRPKDTSRLVCTTYNGLSCYGAIRCYQTDICHLLAQHLAMHLNREVEVVEDDRETHYRRTDHPEVHAILDGKKEGISFECPNFCQILESGNNEWQTL